MSNWIACCPAFWSLNFTYITLTSSLIYHKYITLPTKPFTNLSSRSIFIVSMTWTPTFKFKTLARFPVSPIFLALVVSACLSERWISNGTSSVALLKLLLLILHLTLVHYNKLMVYFLQAYEVHILNMLDYL